MHTSDIETAYEQEWLAFAKRSLIKGIATFTIPLSFAFHFTIDRNIAPNNADTLLALRALSIPITLGLYFSLKFIHSRRSLLVFYSFIVQLFLIWLLATVYFLNIPPGTYPNLSVVVLVSGFSFFSVPRNYYIFNSLMISVSSILFPILSTNSTIIISESLFQVSFANLIALILIFEFSRKNMEDGFRGEFLSRHKLSETLKNRDSDVKKLAADLVETKINAQIAINEKSKMDYLYRLARQVAHDIRSPLSALTIAAKNLNQKPIEAKQLIESAADRIQSIAGTMTKEFSSTSLSAVDVKTTLQLILSEKKSQMDYSKLSCPINFNDFTNTKVLCKANQTELSRVFSNLIQNSIEAVSQKPNGIIDVSLKHDQSDEPIFIIFKDNGPGVPDELVNKLGQYGFTYGKSEGSGLGLAHAYSYITSIGGSIAYERDTDHTIFKLMLPVRR